MKIQLPKSNYLITLAVAASLSLSATARAADQVGSDQSGEVQNGSDLNGEIQNDGEQGGQITGSESIDEKVSLVPATPTPGLGGSAKLEIDDENGITLTNLELNPVGLSSGTYGVNAILTSGSTVALDNFVVTASTDSTDNEVQIGDATGNPLPTGVNPFDIRKVVITTGTDGAPVLTADFSGAATSGQEAFHASVPTISDTAAPESKGHLVIKTVKKHGILKGLFLLKATKLPSNALMALSVNGRHVSNVRSDENGHITVSRTPGHSPKKGTPGSHGANTLPVSVDILKINTVSLHFENGGKLLHANL